jgi:hypothetical protein
MMGTESRNTVFVSYSHMDARWLERLRIHLAPLLRDQVLDLWDDTKILPGQDWRKEIENALARARVAVLLISANFLASDFISSEELPRLLAAAEAGGAVILPVIVSSSRFIETPALSRFQAVNPPDRPLNRLSKAAQEDVLVKVSAAVERALTTPIGLKSPRPDVGDTRQIPSLTEGSSPQSAREGGSEEYLTSGKPEPLSDVNHQYTKAVRDVPDDPTRATSLLNAAIHAAYAADEPHWQVRALMKAVRVFAVLDSARAARLADEAERLAQTITDERPKTDAIVCVVAGVAFCDPDRAGRLAETITGKRQKMEALEGIAEAIAVSDPDRAEHLAQASTDNRWKARHFMHLATVVAPSDPDRAARLTGEAEHLARTITHGWSKAQTLIAIAAVITPSDPDRAARLTGEAEHLARTITDGWSKAQTLIAIAAVITPSDPGRAAWLVDQVEQIADGTDQLQMRAGLLKIIAGTVASSDPGRAAQIIDDIEQLAKADLSEHGKAGVLSSLVEALGRVAAKVAPIDPSQAEALAACAERYGQSISVKAWQTEALTNAAVAVASFAPARAERLARLIQDNFGQARALTRIAAVLAEVGDREDHYPLSWRDL